LDIVKVIAFSPELRMGNFDDLVDQIAGSSLEPLVSHVLVLHQEVVGGTSNHIERKSLQTLGNLLPGAKMALSANDLALSLTPWTDVSEDVVEAVPQINATSYPTLSVALLTSHNVVWVLSTAALAMWASHLFLDKNRQPLTKIEVLQR